MRRAALTTLLVALVLTAALATTAEAATTRSLCARSAVLRDSPKGFVIARLRPSPALARAAPQRQPPLGARRHPRRPRRLASRQEPLPCLSCEHAPATTSRSSPRSGRGDEAAFGQIFARHHDVLLRYARRVLGRSSEHAEDVVQEAMFRASRALRRDERHIELRPWLFRLVRNCALDELARVRTDSVALDDADEWGMLHAPAATQPEVASEQRGKVRDLLGDISGLPAPQRHALLRREVDGISHAALAAELGVSEQATKNLVHRARMNLVKHEEARSTDCQDVRLALLEAHDEGRRASAATYRHVATCRACRTFRAGLKDTSRAVAMLVPGPLLLIAIGVVAGKVGAAGAKAAMLKTGATAAAGRCPGRGRRGRRARGLRAGRPRAAVRAEPGAAGGGRGEGRAAADAARAVIRRAVRFGAGAPRATTVTLACPAGLRVAELLALRGAAAATRPARSRAGASTARVSSRRSRGTVSTRVSVLCKAPDARRLDRRKLAAERRDRGGQADRCSSASRAASCSCALAVPP